MIAGIAEAIPAAPDRADEEPLPDQRVEVDPTGQHVAARVRGGDLDAVLGGEGAVLTISAATDWARLFLDGRRDLIRATVGQVTVAPGRGPDRVTVELLRE